jgi:hypothetical protein
MLHPYLPLGSHVVNHVGSDVEDGFVVIYGD